MGHQGSQPIELPSQFNIASLRQLRLKLITRETNSNSNSELYFLLKSDGTAYDLGIILARGLDQMIAALAIWEAKYPNQVDNHQKLDDALASFFNSLVQINNNPSPTDQDKLLLAKKTLKTLTGKCLTYLGMKNTKSDIQTFLTVRDIVYKEHFGSYSVRSDIYSQESDISKKLGTVVYQPIDFSKSSKSKVSVDITEQYKLALKDPKKSDKENEWVDKFLKDRQETLKTLSMPPMMRVAAVQANAYTMTFHPMETDQGESKTKYPSFYSMAFAVPFKIKDKSKRDDSTKLNLQLMLTDESVLLETAQAFRDRWQPGTPGIITLPLTYQTLVTRIALKKMPDYDKSANGLEEIAEQVNALVAELKDRQFILQDNQLQEINSGEIKPGEIKFDSPIYQFEVLTTNTCINRYHKISAERERDYQTIKTLLALTKAHIDRELNKSAKDKDKDNDKIKNYLQIVRHFLDKPDTSYFTPYLSRGQEVKQALLEISKSNEQLGLLLSAAVELKVCSHETVFGSLRRKTLDKIQPRWLQQMLRVLSFILASLIKIPVAPILLSHWLKHHNSRRNMFYRAAYLNIVAAQLGRSVSSCMSSADRQKELDSFIAALMADFEQNKKLLGFNDPVKDKKNFIKKYQLSANQIKRNIVRIATGSPSTQDNELLPFFHQFGSRAGFFVEHSQKELNKIVKSLRYAKSALVVKLAGITMAQAFGVQEVAQSVTLDQALSANNSDSVKALALPAINFFSSTNNDSQQLIASNKIKWRWIIAGVLLLGAAAGLICGTDGLGLVAIPLGVWLKCLLVKIGVGVLAKTTASSFVAAGASTLFAGLCFNCARPTEEASVPMVL